MRLPDGVDVHRLRRPRPVPGGRGREQRRGVTAVGLAVSRVVLLLLLVVLVRRRRVAVVQEPRRVGLCRVHALHGGVHVVHQLLQIHVVLCGGSTGCERRRGEGREKGREGREKERKKVVSDKLWDGPSSSVGDEIFFFLNVQKQLITIINIMNLFRSSGANREPEPSQSFMFSLSK